MTEDKVTPKVIRSMKGCAPIAALTAYDFPTTRLLDDLNIPLILVGDSLGMVILGYLDTTGVTMDDMVHHVGAAARAKPKGLLVADMPCQSCLSEADAVSNARRLVEAGAEAVKAEGGLSIVKQVKAIKGAGIEFLGHLGMLPQSVKEEGGYHVKGRRSEERDALMADAKALEEAGAFAIVLELVEHSFAAELTRLLSIPTIGIASGGGCDGQILVTTDLLGTTAGYIPKHVGKEQRVISAMREVIRDWIEARVTRKGVHE